MKLFAIALSAWMMVFQCQAHANSYSDKKIFEEDAKQDVLKGQSSRENMEFRETIVTEFSDSLNLCGEIRRTANSEWVRFIKVYDTDTERFNSVWVEPSDPILEVEEFKRNQFDSYWDRRCLNR